MSNWVPITLDTLHESSIAALIDACDSAALAANEANRSPGIIQDVVNYIRRKIASHQRNQLDQDTTTIPQGLRSMATDLIIARLKKALEMELSKDESDNLKLHEKNLDRIAAGTDVVDQPDTAVIASMEPLIPPPAFGNSPHRRKTFIDG